MLRNILKFLPVEIYALVLPATLVLCLFLVFEFLTGKDVSFWLNYRLLIPFLFLLAFVILSLWFIFAWRFFSNFLRKDEFNQEEIKEVKKRGGGVGLSLISFIIIAVSVVTGISSLVLFTLPDKSDVLMATLSIDWLEKIFFGVIPAFELIKIFGGSFVEKLFLYSYNLLLPMIYISFLIAALWNKTVFRTNLIAFFTAIIIALPLWALMPATSPDGLYIAKIFGEQISENAGNLMVVSGVFQDNLNFSHDLWISGDNYFINVSSIPSLHAAWGVIITMGAFMLNWRVGLLFLPWLLFNLVGTFYSLQHYAVDVVFGVILGLFCVYLAKRLIELEKKYYRGEDYYLFCDFLSNRTN